MRILMTMFGWRESGGGTLYPRLLARHLVQRGHEVLVVYAGLPQVAGGAPYTVMETVDEGVRLAGIHNRPTVFLDDQHPEREVSDPAVNRIVRHYLDQFDPDVVHYHNFLGLSMGFVAEVARRQIPSLFSLHNFWLLCPTLYLFLPQGVICQGINATGSNCLACTRAQLPGSAYLDRHRLLCEATHMIDTLLVGAPRIAEILIEQGYDPGQLEVLPLANQRAEQVWTRLGRDRPPFAGGTVRFGFMGSVIPLKGIETLVQAAQSVQGDFLVEIYGEISPGYQQELSRLDQSGKLRFHPPFEGAQLPELLSRMTVGVVPSLCHEQAGLVVGEFQAGRVPVIVSDAGGLSFYLQPESAGRVFEAGSVSALAARMQELVAQPELIRQMQTLIEPPLSFAAYLDRLETLYRQGLEARAGARRQLQQLELLKRRHLEPPGQQSASATLDLPYWIPAAPDGEARLPAEKSIRLLGFVPPKTEGEANGETGWQSLVQAFWRDFGPEDDVALVLAPWQQSLDDFYADLLDWIAAAGLDPEQGPELVILDPEDIGSYWHELAAQVNVFVAPGSLNGIWPPLITAFNAPILALRELPPPPYAALLEPKSPASPIEHWLTTTAGLTLLSPNPAAIACHNAGLEEGAGRSEQ